MYNECAYAMDESTETSMGTIKSNTNLRFSNLKKFYTSMGESL
jgi:hypothetical protein